MSGIPLTRLRRRVAEREQIFNRKLCALGKGVTVEGLLVILIVLTI
jgi:hypothetical protein